MSSIDKGVRRVAKDIDPRVVVTNVFGRITGTINGRVVFSIADRYGYVDSRESKIIADGINAFNEAEEENRRREAERLENERRAAMAEARREAANARTRLKTAYDVAISSYDKAAAGAKFSGDIKKIDIGYDVSAYKDRAAQIEAAVARGRKEIEREYQAKLAEIDTLEKSITDTLDTGTYNSKTSAARRIGAKLTDVRVPIKQIQDLREEIDKLSRALADINLVKGQLKRITSSPKAERIIKEVEMFKITSVGDVDALAGKLNALIVEIKDEEYAKQSAKNADMISALEGALSVCVRIKKYVIESNYEAYDNSEEVKRLVAQVSERYAELEAAEFSTCSQNELMSVYKLIGEIINSGESGENIVSRLGELIDKADVYHKQDRALAPAYNRYKNIKTELLKDGIPEEEIGAFDPENPAEQVEKLTELLYKGERGRAVSRTRMNFYAACRAMEEMGYKALHHSIGLEENEDDALLCEAVYVIPGCQGVVYRVSASDESVNRSLVGILRERTNMQTPHERVKEVAAIMEADGEGIAFLRKFAEITGEVPEIESAVDVDTDGADAIVKETPAFVLDENVGEEIYNAAVEVEDKAVKEKWQTKKSAAPIVADVGAVIKNDKERQEKRKQETVEALKKKCRSSAQ